MKYAFFPGCSLSATARSYGLSSGEVTKLLGIELEELKNWNCCGTSVFPTIDERSALTMSGRNLALAEKAKHEQMITPCPGCLHSLQHADHELSTRPEEREAVQETLQQQGLEYTGAIRLRHLLDVLLQDVGLDAIKSKVMQPLKGLTVACYYGCLLTRPPKLSGAPEPENPTGMERIMIALGAETVDWSYKTECCGAFFSLPRPDLGVTLTDRILANIRAVGADAVVTACPVCQGNLDKNQVEGEEDLLPIFYITELMGVAFGLSPRSLGLDRHFQDTLPVLRERSLVS